MTLSSPVWVEETFRAQVRFGLRVRALLADVTSPYQRVQVFDTEPYGKVLVLDGVFQTSVRDEARYHEMLVHPALTMASRIERILVVGGGDGGTVREVLRHEAVAQVTLVEIDPTVVALSKAYLPEIGSAWDDPRLEVRIGDALDFLFRAEESSFDVILVDGSDPVGPSEGLFDPSFFGDCQRALSPEGLYVMQSGSPFSMEEIFYPTVKTLKATFGQARPCFVEVPLYAAGPWSFTIAGASVAETPSHPDRISGFADALSVYSPARHAAAFVPDAEVARRLGAP